ncbi:hypothetical protein MPC1_1810007 [Methylocella tundrae]|nr:hypothetical protein MPC1_1810007 [Methylocella tundrae]
MATPSAAGIGASISAIMAWAWTRRSPMPRHVESGRHKITIKFPKVANKRAHPLDLQALRALRTYDWGTRGRGFESRHSDH